MVMAQPEGAWYLRGYIGVGITNQFDYPICRALPMPAFRFAFDQHSMGRYRLLRRRRRL